MDARNCALLATNNETGLSGRRLDDKAELVSQLISQVGVTEFASKIPKLELLDV